MTTLERMTDATKCEAGLEIDVELHERAKHVLGYSAGIDEISREEKRNAELERLLQACDDLHIRRPFTPESVRKYKDELAPPTGSIQWWASGVAVTCLLAMIFGPFVGIIHGICLFAGNATATEAYWIWGIVSLATGLFFSINYAFPNAFNSGSEWKRFTVGKCDPIRGFVHAPWIRPIPEFAMQTACELKERLPHLTFFVDSLESNPDPFLLCIDGAEEAHYLEVWNEPKYKQERMA